MDGDMELITLAKSGDINAFEQLILQYEKMVYNIARRMLQNEEEAKDAAQEAFIKIYKSIKKFDGKSAFSTWVYRVTVNTCIDELRKKKNKDILSLDGEIESIEKNDNPAFHFKQENPEDMAVKKERALEIAAAIQKLDENHRAIVVLRDINGFSYTDIADILNINIGTVKSRLARARGQLKSILVRWEEQNNADTRLKDRKEESL